MDSRFRHNLIAALGHAPNGPLALAVSGGPDSMAMLALAAAAFPGQVVAATVDHGLRSESAGEAELVSRYCNHLGVPHTLLTPPADWSPKTIQADARHMRYAVLGDWATRADAAALLTAHHADDQAETFLMRAARGSGVAGLGGIRARWTWDRDRWRGERNPGTESLPVIRPLLGWRRSDLAAVVAAAGVPCVTDPSNADRRFDRVRIRALLAAHAEIDPVHLAQAAAACAEADGALAEMTATMRKDRMRDCGIGRCRYDMTGLPREIRRRLARDAIGDVRMARRIAEGHWSDGANVEPLLDALESGGKATLAGVVASAEGWVWTFAAAPPRRSP